MSTAATGKIEELESIRGLAALLVVLFHMPNWNAQLHDIRLIRNGYYMVDLFFVLSGFVMSLNYGQRLNSAADLARFQFLRFGRLYPVHGLFLLVAVATAATAWAAASLFGVPMPNGSPFKDTSPAAFAAQLLLVHSLGFFKVQHPFNLPSWSISVEFYTYLLFGVVCVTARRTMRLSAFCIISTGALVLLALRGSQVGDFSEVLQGLAGYFLGCLVAAAALDSHSLPRGTTFAALLLIILFLSSAAGPQFNIAVFPFSALLIAAVISSKDDLAKRILRHQSLKFLGLISYSVYMSHTFVLWVCNQFIRVVLKRVETTTAGISTPQLSVPGAMLWYGIAVGSTLAVSFLVYRYVEDPCRLASKQLVRRFGRNFDAG